MKYFCKIAVILSIREKIGKLKAINYDIIKNTHNYKKDALI